MMPQIPKLGRSKYSKKRPMLAKTARTFGPQKLNRIVIWVALVQSVLHNLTGVENFCRLFEDFFFEIEEEFMKKDSNFFLFGNLRIPKILILNKIISTL